MPIKLRLSKSIFAVCANGIIGADYYMVNILLPPQKRCEVREYIACGCEFIKMVFVSRDFLLMYPTDQITRRAGYLPKIKRQSPNRFDLIKHTRRRKKIEISIYKEHREQRILRQHQQITKYSNQISICSIAK